jgi:hypothetical protein
LNALDNKIGDEVNGQLAGLFPGLKATHAISNYENGQIRL